MAFLHSVAFVLAIQRFATPWLDVVFRSVSFLGTEFFYLGVLVFLYFRVSRKLAFRLAVVVLFSLYVNFLLKEFFGIPRPDGEGLRILEAPEDFSFPSGHAQSVASFWFFLAFSRGGPFWYALAGIFVTLVSFSRLYLGVHYLQDVLAGAALGVLLALGFARLFRYFEARTFPLLGWLPFLGGASLALFFFAPSSLGIRVAGSLSGVLWGYWLAVFFGLPEQPLSGVACGLGAVLLVVLYLGGKALGLQGTGWGFARYFLLNLVATFGWPLLWWSRGGKKSHKEVFLDSVRG